MLRPAVPAVTRGDRMLAAQERRLQAYHRAREFVKAHAEPLAGQDSARETRFGLFAKLDDLIARVERAAVEQESGTRASQAATKRLRAAVHHLRLHYLKHLAVIAHAIREEVVGVDLSFRLPRTKTPVTQLLAGAEAMLAEARQHEDLMVRWGMTKDFVAGMRRAIDAVSHEVEQRNLARQQQVGATAALEQRLEETRMHLDILGTLVDGAWEAGSPKRTEWRSARSVQKPRRAAKASVEAVPAPAPQLLLPAGSAIPLLAEASQPDVQRIRRAPG